MDRTPNTQPYSEAFERGLTDGRDGRKSPARIRADLVQSYLAGFRRGRTLRNRKLRAKQKARRR